MEDSYLQAKFLEKDSSPEQKEVKKWTGIYRGIRYEINYFESPPTAYSELRKHWTHYIWLNLDDQFEKEIADKFWLAPTYRTFCEGGREHVSYDYYNSIINAIEFHGGCTWYSKESTEDDKKRVVKIGCDYQHLWDEGMTYSLGYVFGEAKQTIDSLYEVVPKIKVRNWGNGHYYFPTDFPDAEAESCPKARGE